MSVEIHIAGLPVKIGPRVRQRCAWCGAIIDDADLNLVAVAMIDGTTSTDYPSWEVGSLVAIDGVAHWSVSHDDGDPVPEGCCARLDPEVTA